MLLNYSFIPLLLHHFVTTVLVAVEVCLCTSAGLENIEASLFFASVCFSYWQDSNMFVCFDSWDVVLPQSQVEVWLIFMCCQSYRDITFFVTLTGQQSVSTDYACCFENAVLSHPQRQVYYTLSLDIKCNLPVTFKRRDCRWNAKTLIAVN